MTESETYIEKIRGELKEYDKVKKAIEEHVREREVRGVYFEKIKEEFKEYERIKKSIEEYAGEGETHG